MALLSFIGGVAERAQASTARAASGGGGGAGLFLKLGHVTGDVKSALLKIEYKYLKLTQTLTALDHKLTQDLYGKHASFLKIRDAGGQFLKIHDANGQFLKITDAGAQYLKVTDAGSQYLKIDDAAGEYLKAADATARFLGVGGTAADSHKLGGLTPDSFVQGHANVVSGALTLNGNLQPLVALPNGIIVVKASANSDGTPQLMIHNGTSSLLPAVQMADGSVRPLPLSPNSDNVVMLAQGTGGAHEVQIQIFPNAQAGLNEVVSILIGLEPNPNVTGATQVQAVGQMLIGLL